MNDKLTLNGIAIRTDMPFELLKAASDSCVVYDDESCIFHVHAIASNDEDIEVSVVCQFVTDEEIPACNQINVSMDGQNMTVNAKMINWINDFFTISNRIKIFTYCDNVVYIEFLVNSIGCINDSTYAERKKRYVTMNVYTQSVEMAAQMKVYEDQQKALAIAKAEAAKTKEEMEKLKENSENGFGLGALAGMMNGMMGGIPSDMIPPSPDPDIIDSEAKEVTENTYAEPGDIPPDEDGTQYKEL